MIPGAVHKSRGIYLTAEENISLETFDEGCVIASNGATYLQMRSVGSHKSGRDGVRAFNFIVVILWKNERHAKETVLNVNE